MKPILLLASVAAVLNAADVRAVYVLPMSGGLDQYLASRLASAGVFTVVADPKRAGAVLTDRIGEAFEKRMAELSAAPEADAASREKAKTDDRVIRPFGGLRGRGTIFLIDTKSREILWSAIENPKNATSGALNRAAGRIVERIKKDLKGSHSPGAQ